VNAGSFPCAAVTLRSSCSVVLATNLIVGRCTASAIASASLKSSSAHCYRSGHLAGINLHRDQAMRVCGSGDVRRRRLPCRLGKAANWRAAHPLGQVTTSCRSKDGVRHIVAHDVERFLTDIDADHGDRGIGRLR
jgi:hypothetical protein